MANKPRNIKIVFESERTRNIREAFPTTESTYWITADEESVMVERDYQLRREQADDPTKVKRRSIHTIFDELSKVDINNAKQHLRNTTYRSITGRGDDEEISIIDVAISLRDGEDPAECYALRIDFQRLLATFDEIDQKIVACLNHGFKQAEISERVGISQVAVSKRIKKLEKVFQDFLASRL